MSVPVHTVPYSLQLTNIAVDPTVSFDLDQDWTGAETFEVNRLPAGFTFNPLTNLLGGEVQTDIVYYLAVRARNADGWSLWSEIPWIAIGSPSGRILFGPSQIIWQEVSRNPAPMKARIQRATLSGRQSTWNTGALLLSDIPDNEGNASRYGAEDLDSEFIVAGDEDAFMMATRPGWEIILDFNA